MSTTITPKHSATYEVGAILCDQGGYEQTNVDFYCIVKMSDTGWVTVAPMTKITKPGAPLSMETREMPGVINPDKPVIRKKLKVFNGEIAGFSFRNYTGGGWCRLWNGKDQLATHYA